MLKKYRSVREFVIQKFLKAALLNAMTVSCVMRIPDSSISDGQIFSLCSWQRGPSFTGHGPGAFCNEMTASFLNDKMIVLSCNSNHKNKISTIY